MNVITRSSRERELLAIADELGQVFARRAAKYDESAEFPHENIDDLRSSGYLALTVPKELGGLGGDLRHMVTTQERMAAGCASTALVVNMHLSMTGQLARAWRTEPTERAERMLRDVVAGRILLAGATAEPGHSLVRSTGSRARRVPGGYLVSGRKTFGTGCLVMTHMTSMAVDEDHPDGPRVLIFRIPADTPGVEIQTGTWNVAGMRATRSENVTLRDVMVPDDAVTLTFPTGTLDGTLLQTLWGWSMPTFGAVYLGVAVGAFDRCRAEIVKRGWASRPFVRTVVNECEMLIETSRALLHRTADEVMGNDLWSAVDVQEGMSRVVMAKTVATTNAVSVVDLVVQLVGSPALQAWSVYDRAQRDVRAGTMHPYSNADACDLISATSLGLSTADQHPPARTRLATAYEAAPI